MRYPGSRESHDFYVFLTALNLALDSVRAHKLRSFLTLLGVIIGVASVVLVGSAIEGLGVYAEESTAKAFGSDTYLVAQIASVGKMTRKERAEKLRRNRRLRKEDLDYLKLATGDKVFYSPFQQRLDDARRASLLYEGAVVIGVAATMQEIRDLNLVEGRFFTEMEEQGRQSAAVIGDEIRATLFPSTSALGGTIKLRGMDFIVVGVQGKLGSAGGRTQDNSIYIPAPTYARLYGSPASIAIFGSPRPDSGLSFDEALELTRAALRVRLHAPPGRPDNFDVLTPDAIGAFVDNILGLVAVVVLPVTCISLVVGGIVIMNIMLVSVTERTREIGVRMSLGARRSDILLQFLIEAVLMASLGGACGLALGFLATRALSAAFEMSLPVTLPYVLLALFVSGAVGIVSGWYPAARAARLDPVVALRAE